MSVKLRIIAPIACALLCAGALLGFLWWELEESAAILTKKPTLQERPLPEVIVPLESSELPSDLRDEALRRLRQGDLFAINGDWTSAEEQYAMAVNAGGGVPALRKLAQAELQRRNIRGVRTTIQKLKRAGARKEDLLLLESIVELRTGELVKARTLLEGGTDSPQKHYGLALLSIVEGNHDAARAELAFVLEGWEPVLRSYARTLQAAYEEFALFPESPNIHLVTLLARALAQVQECELALPLLVQVTQEREDYRDAWIVQGYCELTTERPAQALTSFERAYNLDPEKPVIQYFLGRTYAALHDPTNALTFFQYALKNGFEPREEAGRQLAIAALEAGNIPLSIEHYAALAREGHTDISSFEKIVGTALLLDQKDAAFTAAEKAAELWPNDARAHDLLGWASIELGRMEEAKVSLEKALAIDPELESAKERMKSL